ncbi:LEC14B protein-like [Aegilops tauschii subsp. strangulata]
MGYGMSRLQGSSEPEGQNSDGSSSVEVKNDFSKLHNDIFHMTRLRSGPSESIRKSMDRVSVTRLLRGREVNSSGNGKFSPVDRAFVLGHYLPVDGPETVDTMDSRAYVSQFSADGSLFVAGFQGSHIRIYDVDKGWEIHKDIHARSLRWTISDAALSPDQRFLVYSSLAPIIHIVNVGTASKESYANVTDIHDGLDFSEHEDVRYSFGLFSVKFSTDGRELVAGSNDDSIYVYDLQANKVTLRLPAHTSDVNTVAFADESGNLLYSGSDDNLCKVWDRRCLSTGEAAGVLTGHLHGITHIDSRGDGRCFISNGKDQAIKMWDIRKMTSNADGSENRVPAWDYRYSRYPQQYKQQKHPHD